MNAAKKLRRLNELHMRASELEQQNSNLRQKYDALAHLLAHQDLMAGMQEQICIEEHTLDSEGGSCRAIDLTVTQQLVQHADNPLLQCFKATDQTAYLSVRDSSPQDIAQGWLKLLSALALALHCHDMSLNPQQEHSSDMSLCRAVTDCNRFLAAVNLLHEDIWPQLWHLNLLTGLHEKSSPGHWQAAVAAAAPTASQLQEARNVLAITTSKIRPMAEAVGRQLQEISALHHQQQPQHQHQQDVQQQQQQDGGQMQGKAETVPAVQKQQDYMVLPAIKRVNPVHCAASQQLQQPASQQQQHSQQQPICCTPTAQAAAAVEQKAGWDVMQLDQATSSPALSSSDDHEQHSAAAAACANSAHASVSIHCPASIDSMVRAVFVPTAAADANAAAITAAAEAAVQAAAAAAGGSEQQSTQGVSPSNSSADGSQPRGCSSDRPFDVSTTEEVPYHFLQVLSDLESREAAMDALCSSMTNWRVLRLMVGALKFLLRPDQLARLYLHSMPFMPIGCLLYDQIGLADSNEHDSASSC